MGRKPVLSDKYDEAVKYCRENFHKIYEIWANPDDSPGGCLFELVGKGCLTMVKEDSQMWPAFDKELERAIKKDKRVPSKWEDITPENLEIFAEWQRRVDKEYKEEREKND